ncbi:MAG: restriction endonuclease subunit S [Gallionella sp.]|jgi:type I restriction enzyme S subunit
MKEEKVTLGDVVLPRREKGSPSEHPELPFIGLEHVEAHTMRLLGTVPAGTMRSNANRFFAGDVLYSRLRPYLNKVFMPTFDGYCSAEFIVFPQSEVVDSAFLKYLLNARDFVSFANHLNAGDRPRVDFEQLSSFAFFLPSYLSQRRIVGMIEELFSELDKGIENLKTARAQLKVYRQSLLKHAFEGKLTAQWRAENQYKLETADAQPAGGLALLKRIQAERAARYQQQLADWQANGGSKPKAPKSLPPLTAEELAELPELPEGWVYTRVGAVIDDPTYGTSKKCDYEVDGVGVLRIPNVISGRVEASDLKFAQFTPDEKITYKLIVGDILIIRSNGSISIVGRCALVSSADLDYLYAGYLIRLRPHQRLVEPGYLLNTLSLHSVRKQIEQKAKSTSGVNNINTGEIQSLVIAICGIEEQKQIQMEIESRLSEVDNLEQTIATSLQQAEALRQSILKKAFSGQLVPQDPHDLPASELLARIRAERAVSQASNKSSRVRISI